jgi:hypothetical protein
MDAFHYIDDFMDVFYDEKRDILHERFDAIQFKWNRTHYHLKKIRSIIKRAKTVETAHFYKEVHEPIYFEMESFLVPLEVPLIVCFIL